MATTYTWHGGTGDWADGSNWSPAGPPGGADIAQADQPSTIEGSGTANQFQTTNQSGTVTLGGQFNFGTIFNGAEMVLSGNVSAAFLETFVQLDVTGFASIVGDSNNPDEGFVQFNGTVDIENGGTVDASQYVIAYNAGTGLPPPPDVNFLDVDAGKLDIAAPATVNASNQIVGGLGLTVASRVLVQDGGDVTTTYLSLEDPDAAVVVKGAGSDLTVTQTSTDPNGVAGIAIIDGTLEVENGGSLSSTFLNLGDQPGSAFIVDAATATIAAAGDMINGIDITGGDVFFRNGSTIEASQLFMGEPDGATSSPGLSITSSDLTITGTEDVPGLSFSGIWLTDGTTVIDKASTVTTPSLEIDSSEVADPATEIGTYATIEGGSTLTVTNSALLGVTDGSSVGALVTGDGSQLLFANQLIVANSGGDSLDGEGATAALLVEDGALVSVDDTADAAGLVVLGADGGDDGLIKVDGDGSALVATDAEVGLGGSGTLFADDGGSIYASGTLDIGEGDESDGQLWLAGTDGAGTVTVGGDLNVGLAGTGTIEFSSSDTAFSGTLDVKGDATFGVDDGGEGTAVAFGGSFTIDGTMIVGGDGSALIALGETDLDVGGDLLIGNGGTGASLFLQDVSLSLGGNLVVGNAGAGLLDWGSSDDQSTTLGTVLIGESADGDGTFVLHDSTTVLNVGTLAVGGEGRGVFDVFNGATAEVTDLAVIGDQAGSGGAIEVETGQDIVSGDTYDTPGASIQFDQDLTVGGRGDGSLLIGGDSDGDGGFVTVAGDLVIGDEADSSGIVTVQNNYTDNTGTAVPSVLSVDGDVYVGLTATGTMDLDGTFDPGSVLNVLDGAAFEAGTDTGGGLVDVGAEAGSNGTVDVNIGALFSAGTLIVGDEGDGSMTIGNGAEATITADVVIGNGPEASGDITVFDDAILTNDGDLVIGGGAMAIVSDGTIEYPAILTVEEGGEVVNTATVDPDTIGGIIIGADANSLGEAIFNGGTLDAGDVTVGEDGNGVLTFENASQGTIDGGLILGLAPGAFGGMDVNDSDIQFAGSIDVGEMATGATIDGGFIPGAELTIENTSTVIDQGDDGIDVAVETGSTGRVIIDNSDVQLATIVAGDGGDGSLTVQNDATLTIDSDATLEAGVDPGASGTITVDGATFNTGADIYLGEDGDGTLNILNGGLVVPGDPMPGDIIDLGLDENSSGTFFIDDSDFAAEDFTIGDSGDGTATIQNGATVDAAGDMILGSDSLGVGTLTVFGTDGTVETDLLVGGQLVIGDLGRGTLNVLGGATVSVTDQVLVGGSDAGLGEGGIGYLGVTYAGTEFDTSDELDIGADSDANGLVTVAFGADLKADGGITLADGINSRGVLSIGLSTVEADGEVDIGVDGTGTIQVNGGEELGGADFNAGTNAVDIGTDILGTGELDVIGNAQGETSAETGDLTVGDEGDGILTVQAGAQLTTTGDAIIGNTGSGNATVDGLNPGSTTQAPEPPSTWTITGDLSIAGELLGGGGTGVLTASDGGIVHVGGEIVMWNGGTVIANGASPGLIEVGGTTLTTGSGLVIDAATTAAAQGTLEGGGTILSNVVDDGMIDLLNGQSLYIDGAVTGDGTLLLDGASVLRVQGSIASTVSIVFDSAPGQSDILELNNPLAVHGTIYDMGAGDAIDLPGVAPAGVTLGVSDDVLTLVKNGGTLAALTLSGDYTDVSFSLTEDGSGNLEIYAGTAPVPGTPDLIMPAELPAFPVSAQEQLTGASGFYVSDPNAPINATYTLRLNDAAGELFFKPGFTVTQSDTAGATPIVLTGSLAQINTDLNNLFYVSSGAAFNDTPATADTITASLTRGDGVTVTGATGYDAAPSAPAIVESGPTTVALGQALSLTLTPSDPFAADPGDDDFVVSIASSTAARGAPFSAYLLYNGQVTTDDSDDSEPPTLAALTNDLGGGNLLLIPTSTGTIPITGEFYEDNSNAGPSLKTFSFNIQVTAATRTTAVTDTWTGLASAILSDGGNWDHGFATGTSDTALFSPAAGVPVIDTTGDGVAAAWDIDASTDFSGVLDATGQTSGAAVDIDQGATATFGPGSELFAATLFNGSLGGISLAAVKSNNAVIVGDTAPAFLNATDAQFMTGSMTIGNQAGASGSRVTMTNGYWLLASNAGTGNLATVSVGGAGFGELYLADSEINATDIRNYQATGYGQIQIGQGDDGLLVAYDTDFLVSVEAGDFSNGELAMSGGVIGAYNLQGDALDVFGGRVDWGGGAVLDLTDGLAGTSNANLGYGVISGDDWTIQGAEFGAMTNNGTIEAAAGDGGPSTIRGVALGGNGILMIDAGATLDLETETTTTEGTFSIGSGQTVVFQQEFNGAGGVLNIIGDPAAFGGTIEAFADGDRLSLTNFGGTGAIQSATYSSDSNTTAVVFGIADGSVSTATIAFTGSLDAGNFALEANPPSDTAVYDYVESGGADQPPVLTGPTDIAATDGAANPFPGLSLSDADAEAKNQTIQLTLTSTASPNGTFSAPATAGLAITNQNGTLTLTGALSVVQAELASIDYTPAAGNDDYIQVTASDGVAPPVSLVILAHNSSYATGAQFTGTANYVYAGPQQGEFDMPGQWNDASGQGLPSGPGIADSATIAAGAGTQIALGGIGVAGQLLTEGLVVLTGSLDLAGLSLTGIGTIDGTGPAFAGALEIGQGELVMGSGARLTLGGDLIVDGEFDSLMDDPWTITGDIDINGGTLRLGGLGALTVAGDGIVRVGGAGLGGELDIENGETLESVGAVIGTGAGTATVTMVGASGWTMTGGLVVGATGDATMTIEGQAPSAATVTIGQSAGGDGTLSVLTTSTLTVASTLTVGAGGIGTLIVTEQNLGRFTAGGAGGDVLVGSAASPGELDVGAAAGGVGVVDISLPGTVTVDGSAYIGGTRAGASGGTGTLEVSGDSFYDSVDGAGLFDVTGGVTIFSGSTALLREGTAAIGSLTIAAGGTLAGDGFVNGPGVPTGTFSNVGSITEAAPFISIVDDGLIDANVDPANGAASLLLYGDVSGSGTIEIEAGATVDIQGSVAAGLTVRFDGTGGELILSQPGGFAPVISGFEAGDMLRLSGVAPGTVVYDSNSGLLTDQVGGTVYSFTFDPPDGAFAALSDTHDGTLLELTNAPVISAPATATIGVGHASPIVGIGVTGTSLETGDTFSVTLSDANGLLSATGAGVSGSGTGTLTITSSAAAIDTALASLTDFDASTAPDTITVRATDETQDTVAQNETIAVTVNGLPVIAAPATAAFDEGAPDSLNTISLSESGDTANENFTVTLTDTTGVLTVTASNATVTGSGQDLTIAGSLAGVNATLNSLTDTDAVIGPDTITINATDGFGNIAATKTIGVTVTPLLPVINAPTTAVVEEGLAPRINGLSLSENDNFDGEMFTVTLVDSTGSLVATGGATITGSGGDDLTISGLLQDVNASLETVTDEESSTASDTIVVNASDSLGNTAVTMTIGVTSNSAPLLSAPSSLLLDVGVTSPVGVTLNETGNTSPVQFTVELSDTNGQLALRDAFFLLTSDVGTFLAMRGTLAEMQNELATLTDTSSVAGGDTINISVSDSLGGTASASIDVTVGGVPVLAGPSTATVGVGRVAAIAGVSVSEQNAGANDLFTVTIAGTSGALSATASGAATVGGAGTDTLTVSGLLVDVNNTLASLKDLEPATQSDTIVINATDATQGTSAAALTIAVTVNGAPVIAAPASASVEAGIAGAIGGIGLSETGDVTGEMFTVTVTDGQGALNAPSGDATVTGSGGTSLTIAGSLDDVNTALSGLTGTEIAASSDTITVGASDSFGNVAATAIVPVTVDEPPVLGAPDTLYLGENEPGFILGVTLSEVGNVPGEMFTVTFRDGDGILNVDTSGGASSSGPGTSLTVSGSLDEVQAAIATLSDTASTAGSDSITIGAADDQGGIAQSTTIAVSVASAPILEAPATLNLGAGQLHAITGVTLAENDATPGEIFTVTLSDTNGELTASAFGTAIVRGPGTTSLTISGDLGDVNTTLLSLEDTDGTAAPDTIAIGATDGFGNSAGTDTIVVTVSGPPVLTAPAAVVIPQSTATEIAGLSLAESGATTNEIFSVTLTDATGLLLTTSNGLATVSGSDTDSLTIRGALGEVNTALANVFDTDGTPGPDTIQMRASDSFGNTDGPVPVGVTVMGTAPSLAGEITLTSATAGVPFPGTTEVADFTDTVPADTEGDFTVTIDWGDGTSSAGAVIGANGTFSVDGGHTYASSFDGTLTVTIDDSDDDTQLVLSAPVGVASQLGNGAVVLTAATAGITLPATTEVAVFDDANASDTAGDFTASIVWGDGAVTAGTVSGANGAFLVDGGHTYANPGLVPLSVSITDLSDDAQLALGGTVAVGGGDVLTGQGLLLTANAGTPFSGIVADFSDVDTASLAGAFAATIDWGDGTSSAGTVTGGGGSFAVAGIHTYASAGEDPVTVTLSAIAPGTATATVGSEADVAPQLAGVVTLTAATSGTPLPGTTEIAAFTDANASDTAGDFTATIAWGDGTVSAGSVTGADGTFSVDGGHTYAGAGAEVLGVTIADDGDSAQVSLGGTVDVAPQFAGEVVLTAATAGVTLPGTTAVVNFTDANPSDTTGDFTAVIDWGDGTHSAGTVTGANGSFSVDDGHTYVQPGDYSLSVTIDDTVDNAELALGGTVDVARPAGQSFTLTTGEDIVTGGAGNNMIVAESNTLSAGDQIDGGTGGTNTLNLVGSGTFNLKLPATLMDIQVVNAQEGQAAYSNGTLSFVADNEIVTLRNGLNVTVDVSGAAFTPLNPKPATITINGANDASVINLASGNDVVTLGSAAETVHGGSGDDQIQVTASTIGATIDGGTGQSTLTVLGGGSIVMGGNITDISSVMLASTPAAMSFIANGSSGLMVTDESKGADTVSAGGLDQTLTGGSGQDLFIGFGGGGTNFKDLAAAINGDTISGFLAPNDQIDLTNVGSASLSKSFVENVAGTAGVLTVSDGTHTAAMTLNGSFSAANFRTGSDGGAGTLITYSPGSG